eukprot:6192739-Pleurochrysis_carterae.AAC.1
MRASVPPAPCPGAQWSTRCRATMSSSAAAGRRRPRWPAGEGVEGTRGRTHARFCVSRCVRVRVRALARAPRALACATSTAASECATAFASCSSASARSSRLRCPAGIAGGRIVLSTSMLSADAPKKNSK